MTKEKKIELSKEAYYVVDKDSISNYVSVVYPDDFETTEYQDDAFCFDREDDARALCKLCNIIDDKNEYTVVKISVQVIE